MSYGIRGPSQFELTDLAAPSDGVPGPNSVPYDFRSAFEAQGGLSSLDRLAPGLRQDFAALSRDRDAGRRAEGLSHWALRVERAGGTEAALALYAALLQDPNLTDNLRARVQERSEVLQGRGPLAARFELQTTHLTQEVLSPASILAMGAGGAAFRLTRWALLSRLSALPAMLGRSRTTAALAGFGGFLMEAPTFTLTSQAMRGGDSPLGAHELGEELLRSYITLGGLRIGGRLSLGLQSSLRLQSNALLGPVFRQAGMFGGIWAGGLIEEGFQLHGARSNSERLFDSLVTLLHFNLGGRVAHEILGSDFRAWENNLDRRTQRLSQISRPAASRSALASAWLAPMWMAMGAGGIGGFGRLRGRQLSLPLETLAIPSANSGRVGSIERWGEVFRANGSGARIAREALRERAAENRPAVLAELRRTLQESTSLGRIEAIRLIVELRATELLPELQALNQNRSSPIDAAAEAAQVRLGDLSLIPRLRSRASNPRHRFVDRIVAYEALGRLGERESSVEGLRQFFRHFHPRTVQIRAALALTRLGARAAVLSFETHLERASIPERAEFAQAFFEQRNWSEALPIWEGLAGNGYEGRRLALQLAAAHPCPEMILQLQRLSRDGTPDIRRQAAGILRGLENPAPSGTGNSPLTLLGLGTLTWLLHPALAEASVGSGGGGSSWWLPTLLIGGAATVAALRGPGGSEPPSAGGERPVEAWAWFESHHNNAETYSLPTLGEGQAVIGRSTQGVANVFGADLRNISRRHMDMRWNEGKIEVRLHEGAGGLRINGENLLPAHWYRLRDQDLIEFVGQANADVTTQSLNPEGELVHGEVRFGQRPVEAVDASAIYRFRMNRPADTPIPPPMPGRVRRNLLERIGNLFLGSRPVEAEPSNPPEQSRLERSPQPTAPRTELYTEIGRLAQTLSTPMALLEMAHRTPSFNTPGSRGDMLTGLERIHRQLCGPATTRVPTRIFNPESSQSEWTSTEVPSWNGILARRLQYFENGVQLLEQQRGRDALIEQARLDLGNIRDRLNRLYELVQIFRRKFAEVEQLDGREAARFDAIEQAYSGLREEVPQVGQRVRSSTRGLDAMVLPSQRQLWIEEFRSGDRSSRSLVNLRILIGEIREVGGRPIAGNFYTALSSGTIYEGRRNVRFYYDKGQGQILGFDDGSPAADTAIRRFLTNRHDVEGGVLSIDPAGSGRITEVVLDGTPPRDSIAEGIYDLINLRVLPPQVIHGWNGYEGDPDLRGYRLDLVPEVGPEGGNWYQVKGLVRQFRDGQSLVTLEPLHPNSELSGIQLQIPKIDTAGMMENDVLTVEELSP